jgi:hypothetical protein
LNGSDDCSTADVITGLGPFTFDNTAGVATTGLNGQLNTPACTFFNLTAIALDVWFLWTAPTTGVAQIQTCGNTTVDTKIAVYNWTAIGSTCPANGAGSTVVACNDDISAFILQARAVFNATAGTQYLIQLGSFPAATPVGGTGSFEVKYTLNDTPADCTWETTTDTDIVSRIAIAAAVPGNEVCWMTRYGMPGDNTSVSAIEAMWGGAFNLANSAITDGTATRVMLWDDPNDDGNPNDLVLVEEVATVVVGHDTDTYTAVPLTSAHTVAGTYFVGCSIIVPNPLPTAPQNFFPVPIDAESCSPVIGDVSWAALQNPPPMNMAAMATNTTPPAVIGHNAGGVLTQNATYRIRPVCAPIPPFPGNSICTNASLGTDHTTPCPCGNSGLAGNGCAHSFSADGGNLAASGVIADDNVGAPGPNPVILTASNLPATAFTLFMQHDAVADVVFHDGVLCAGGTLIRLRGRAAGVSQFQAPGVAIFPNSAFPNDATLTLSSRGGMVPGNGLTRRYAGWYRNASTSFCPPATANVSNGWEITW